MANHFIKYRLWYLGGSSLFLVLALSMGGYFYFNNSKNELTELDVQKKIKNKKNYTPFESFEKELDKKFEVSQFEESEPDVHTDTVLNTFSGGTTYEGRVKSREQLSMKQGEVVFLEIEVPYMVEAHLEVNVKENVKSSILQVSGPIQMLVNRNLAGDDSGVVSERKFSAFFYRKIQLPPNVNIEKIEVISEKNLVKIYLPLIEN